MVRVMFPDGQVKEAKELIPIVETNYILNGKSKNVAEASDGFRMNPTGILIKIHTDGVFSEERVFSNMTTERIKELFHNAIALGYIDLSGLDVKKLYEYNEVTLGDGQVYEVPSYMVISANNPFRATFSPFDDVITSKEDCDSYESDEDVEDWDEYDEYDEEDE